MSLSQKIAYVDLSSGKTRTESISSDLRKRFLGGRGLDIYLLLDQLKAGVDALAPENTVIVSAGMLAGTLSTASGRTNITSKSPLTGFLGGSNVGGFFAPEMRRAGFDHLVITGKAKNPSLVLLHGGKVRIHDASAVWGQTIPDAQEILRKELEDDNIQTLCIGPAGENRVRFASVATRHQAASGRTGMGAVFGSKNLKAVIARGDAGIRLSKPVEALAYDKEITHSIATSEFGRKMQKLGASAIGADTEDLFSEETIGMDGCFGCQLHCRRRYVIKTGPYAGTYAQGPGYAEHSAWTNIFGENRTDLVLVANYLANSLGLDSLETASLIGWAMRLNAEKALKDEEMSATGLKDVDPDGLMNFIGMIARREGLGDVLADGGAGAAAKIGRGSALHLREIKGLADIFDHLSVTPWQALGVATAARGSDHLRFLPSCDPCRLPDGALKELVGKTVPAVADALAAGGCDYSTAPWLVLWSELLGMAVDSLGICEFQSELFDPAFPGFEEFSKMVSLNVGLDLAPAELKEACERAIALERLFNLREGYSNTYEQLDSWCPAKNEIGRGYELDEGQFELMLRKYYQVHGWSPQGVPTTDTLKKLGLGQFSKAGSRK